MGSPPRRRRLSTNSRPKNSRCSPKTRRLNLVVDEAAEMRAIRLAEIALSSSGEGRAEDEFLCQNCFLLKKSSQLADKRRQLCNDCA